MLLDIKLNSVHYRKNPLTNDNRRREMRFPIRKFQNKYQLYFTFPLKKQWQECELYDFCLSGAAVRISQIILPGDILYFKLRTEDKMFIFKTRVANTNGIRIGVEFVQLDDSQHQFIEKVIHRYFTA
ncbi:MAG: PilZ domain-containing protein [Spirochaetes bacterium]|nr:PilZ domain-containing protein [Spirochaetota bacterium]